MSEEKKSVDSVHWLTAASEKVLLVIIGITTCIASLQYLFQMYLLQEIVLADLFMLFIFTEILAMVAAFYSSKRIPVTLPIIIAITALCRLIVMQNKDMDALIIIAEASAVLILAGAAYLMSLKDKLSLEKLRDQRD
ncbi:MAG: phosphate-starvation-inducible PsiE family protein [Gammaproteobacteria bacterium]|jgi:protein PsiE